MRPFANEPTLELRRAPVRESLAGALTELEPRLPLEVPVLIGDDRRTGDAIAVNRRLGAADGDLELQVLRGLGDDLQDALAENGLRVRTYCPVGDLVAGMAYLVRRLLENTSNESFLADAAAGRPLEELLAAP